MRINHNVMAMNVKHRQYTINTNSVANPTEKTHSDYRSNRAGADAAGLAASEKMRAQIQGLKLASTETSDAISLTQTAQGALQETQSTLQRMRELSSLSASGEPGIDRAALDSEFQQLAGKLDSIASDTQFNGKGVIDGTYAAITPADLKAAAASALGDNAAVAWEANPIVIRTGPHPGEEMELSIGDMRAGSLGVEALSITDAQSAALATSRVDEALSLVSAEQSSMDEVQGNLRYAISKMDTRAENLFAAESRIRDFDIAAEAVKYTRNSILQQGSTAALAQASNVPQGRVLSLLD